MHFRRAAQGFSALLLLFVFASVARAALIQSPNDQRQYENFSLDNGLEVVVISDPTTDKAAASMNVLAGSADNPEERPGLAHFLEHMLFLGTEKYPESGAYQEFISANGGSHNAYTAYDNTNYFFDVKADALSGALDRFSQFFIAPLFTPELVDRERHAVHSEFKSQLQDDGRRLYSASKLPMNPEHPFSRFFVGNLDTLADRPNSDVRDELIKFYESHYSANLMDLVVIGRQSTAELRAMVEQYFNAIPNRKLEHTPSTEPLYKPEQLPVQLDVVTKMDTRQLSLRFPVPAMRDHWREKPLYYIASMIGYEGKGSLLSLLKEKGWARGLGASPGMDLANQASFDVGIELTQSGLEHYDQVVELFFAFVEKFKAEGVREDLYDEEAQLAATDFRFHESGEPVHEAMQLAARMPDYPVENLLDGPYLYDRFDADLIQSYLDKLTPENMILTLAAPDLKTDSKTERYGIEYSLGKPDSNAERGWDNPQADDALAVRSLNPYVAKDLSLIQPEGEPSETPEALWQAKGAKLWFLQDLSFNVPRANLYFTFISETANDSARHAVLNTLFARMLDDRMNEDFYDASLAGLSASIYPHMRGFGIRISGYNQRQPVLLDSILDEIKQQPESESRFRRIKNALTEELENADKDKPYNQTFSALYTALMPQWSEQQKLDALASISLKDLQEYLPELFSGLYLRSFAHGNISSVSARQMASKVYESLVAKDPAEEAAQLPVVQLPAGKRLYDTLDIEHNDSALTLYMQGNSTAIKARAEVALLNEIMQTPFYSSLRTEQQLGYIVFSTPLPMQDVPGIALVVQSPVADPDKLEAAYDEFLEGMSERLSTITEEELAAFKQSLISRINQSDKTLKNRSARLWRELDRENPDFNTREALTAATLQITPDSLAARLSELRTRQLALRSYGGDNEPGSRDDKALLNALKEDKQFVPGTAAP
ncbi:insulinase family protein [Marinobacterium lutimaris]|uniref:Protease 3 n=1 Tax=Marinobacterium lutimaris TaxID=568106 RepID=A0A1H6CD46_9GAMM|nr:insulinase family protein [Marinobacterium lutimaris]SEG70286.1 Secreted Zn-dependent peptidases, insulinase-like [Marinobacterium lutimaris]